MTKKRLNARIDSALARKLSTLRRITQKTTTEIIKTAIERYYETVAVRTRTPYEILSETGFVGVGEGPPDLSLRVKEELDFEGKA